MAIEQVSIEIKTNAKDVEKDLLNIDKQLKALKGSKTKIEFDTKDLVASAKEIASVQDQIKDLNKAKATLELDQKDIIDTQKNLVGLQDTLSDIDKQYTDIEVGSRDIPNVQDGIDDINEKLKGLDRSNTTINISHNIEQVGSALDGLGSKLLSVFNPFKSAIGQIASTVSIFNLVDSAINQIVGSLDTAIGRFDTLSKYPKVMTSLGFSTDQAENSIARLSEGVDGLPTKLDSIVAINQQITSVTGDIERATETTIALNNAFLASGATEDAASRGAQQFIKILSTGEVNLQSWQSLLQTMPVSLTKVANAMGYTGKSASNDLYEGLKKGSVSIDAFTDTLIALGTEEGELANLARINSEGIGTSFSNLKYAVARNVANILGDLDELSIKLSGKSLAGNIDSLKGIINQAFGFVRDNIYRLEPIIISLTEKFSELRAYFSEFDWKAFGEGLREGTGSLKSTIQTLSQYFQPLLERVKELITAFGGGSFEKGLGKLPALFIKVAVASKVLGKSLKVLGKFSNLQLPSIFGGKTSKSTLINFNIGKMLEQIKNVALIFGILKVIQEAVTTLKKVDDELPANFIGLANKIGKLGLVIAAMEGFIIISGKIASKNLTGTITGLALVAAISVELILLAEALNQINRKVPTNVADVALKVANIAIAVGAIAALSGVIGLITSTGIGGAAIISGLVVVGAIALEIIVLAEAMKQLDQKVPTDISGVKKKIESLFEIITFFNESSFGNLLDVFSNLFGSINVGIITGTVSKMSEVAEEIIKFNEITIPGNAKNRIIKLQEILAEFAGVGLGDLIGDFFENIDIGLISNTIEQYIVVAENLHRLAKTKLNVSGVEKKIQNIIDIIYIIGSRETNGIFADWIDSIDIGLITGTVEKYTALAESLNQFAEGKLKRDNIKVKLNNIIDIISIINDRQTNGLFADWIDSIDIGVIAGTVEKYTLLAETLNELGSISLYPAAIKTKIKQIEDAIGLISSDSSLLNSIAGLIDSKIDKSTFSSAQQSFDAIKNIASSLEGIGKIQFDYEEVRDRLEEITEVVEMVSGGTLGQVLGAWTKKLELGNIIESFQALVVLAESLGEIYKIKFDTYKAKQKIQGIADVIEYIGGATLIEWFESAIKPSQINDTIKSIDKLIEAADSINAVADVKLKKKRAIKTIDDIYDVIKNLDKLNEFDSVDYFSNIVGSIKALVTELNGLINEFTMTGRDYGDALIQGWDDANVNKTILERIDELIKELKKKEKEFKDLGKKYGEAMKNAFSDAIKDMHNAISSQLAVMAGKSQQFTSIGYNFGANLVEGFNNTIRYMADGLDEQINYIQESLNDITTPDLSISLNGLGRTIYRSGGGMVAQYRAGGGQIFKRRGTDTVPAMLTPGEGVLNTKAMKVLGAPFLRDINKLNIKGAANNLGNRLGVRDTISSTNQYIYNNTVNNTQNATINQHINSAPEGYSRIRATNYLRARA